MYEYQKNNVYFAQIAEDIKELGVHELAELGAEDIRLSPGGAYFKAGKGTLYKINYCSKLATRILAPLLSFTCRDTDELYSKAKEIKWDEILRSKMTFAVFSNISGGTITNSHYAALKLKDAVVDSLRERTGIRPDIDTKSPDLWLNLYIRNNRATIAIETSGGSIHKRGYRVDSISAPMQENLAAAIIRHTGWDGTVSLYDPMCGSGTLLAEAVMHYCKIPSGFLREHFGFIYLSDYDDSLWKDIKKDIDSKIIALPDGILGGSDISAKAVKIAESNIKNLPFKGTIKIETKDFNKIKELKNRIIIINPPYGIRVRTGEKLDLFYKSLGDFLKKRCTGSSAYIYFGDRKYVKNIGLKPTWKKPLKAGGLDGRLVKYELF